MQKWDNKGRVNLFGIYCSAIDQIKKDLSNKPHLKKRTITYREFYLIISIYFTEIFNIVLSGLKYNLFNRFGSIRIVKTKLNRYKPIYYKPTDTNENYTKGYWHFIFFDAPKKWRKHNFVFSRKYKGLMMNKINSGFEFPDFTQEGNKGFIYKVK